MERKVPMMSLIGNKWFWYLKMPAGKKNKKKSKKIGFTLLEVMIATTVLALGATLIYQSFFIALDSFNYYSTLLKIAPWMNEKIWQSQDGIRRLGPGATLSTNGQLEVNNKDIHWSLTYQSNDQAGSFYQVDLAVLWPQGARQVKLSRSAYAIYSKK
jgi:prepilin-type N-terminal cleavage/methylation domain-containing protein